MAAPNFSTRTRVLGRLQTLPIPVTPAQTHVFSCQADCQIRQIPYSEIVARSAPETSKTALIQGILAAAEFCFATLEERGQTFLAVLGRV